MLSVLSRRGGRIIIRRRMSKESEQYNDEEAERRFVAALRRGLNTPHKPLKEFVGTTPRAKMMARRRKNTKMAQR